MAGGVNLALKYAKQVDERFHTESQASLVTNSDYHFTGVETVRVYSIPVVAMHDYKRDGANRYGVPDDLGRNVQELTVTQDRSFTFIIDRGDKIQSEMVSDAGKALSRQLREVCIPEYDSYVFRTLAAKAQELGNVSTAEVDKASAYSALLQGMEYMGDRGVPDKGRVALCSYRFAGLLKQDSAFMKYGDKAQEMLIKGVIGEVDGCRIVRVPSSRLPAGTAFLMAHPKAATAPKQLNDYKIHDNPPGISGWLVEGRLIYDCFTLDGKADAIYYHGGQVVVKQLMVVTAAVKGGKSKLTVPAQLEGAKRYYVSAATAAELPAVTGGAAITPGEWTELTEGEMVFTPDKTHKMVRVVEVDAENMPLATGTARLHVG